MFIIPRISLVSAQVDQPKLVCAILTPDSHPLAVLLLLVLSPSFELLDLLPFTNSVVSLHVWDVNKRLRVSIVLPMKNTFF